MKDLPNLAKVFERIMQLTHTVLFTILCSKLFRSISVNK